MTVQYGAASDLSSEYNDIRKNFQKSHKLFKFWRWLFGFRIKISTKLIWKVIDKGVSTPSGSGSDSVRLDVIEIHCDASNQSQTHSQTLQCIPMRSNMILPLGVGCKLKILCLITWVKQNCFGKSGLWEDDILIIFQLLQPLQHRVNCVFGELWIALTSCTTGFVQFT